MSQIDIAALAIVAENTDGSEHVSAWNIRGDMEKLGRDRDNPPQSPEPATEADPAKLLKIVEAPGVELRQYAFYQHLTEIKSAEFIEPIK